MTYSLRPSKKMEILGNGLEWIHIYAKLLQLWLTLCDPMDCSLPGSSVCGILQARTLQWAVMSSSRGIFPTQGSNPASLMSLALAGGFFTIGDMGSIPGSGRSPGKENGNPLLKSPMDKEAWQATYSSQGHKQLDMIDWTNWAIYIYINYILCPE